MLAGLVVIVTEVPFSVAFFSIAPLFSLFVFTLFDVYHQNKGLVEDSFLEKVQQKTKVSDDIAPIIQADCLSAALGSFELVGLQQASVISEDRKDIVTSHSMYQSRPEVGLC
jgi:hypothetical protein